MEEKPIYSSPEFHFKITASLLTSMIIGFILPIITNFSVQYGRYINIKNSFTLNANLSWMIQESPSVLWVIYFLINNNETYLNNPPNLILTLLFGLHYFNRTFIYSLRINKGNPIPIHIVLMAISFCYLNGYIQIYFLAKIYKYPQNWLFDIRFIIGIIMFFIGFFINVHSDGILRNLRKSCEIKEYKIPYGGFFEMVSGANFFGECIGWIGFALACWNFGAFSFAMNTCLFIGQRAYLHHHWYLKKFENYPKNRKAIIPFII